MSRSSGIVENGCKCVIKQDAVSDFVKLKKNSIKMPRESKRNAYRAELTFYAK